MFRDPSFDAHARVCHVFDAPSGLRAIIAIHNTARGPALGGCRAWTYAHDADALTDVLRLSRGMTYKNAMADLPLGGGKSVIVLDEGAKPTPEMFRALGTAVASLGGRYIVAEDVGTSPLDMAEVRRNTEHVAGLAVEDGGTVGDPSPHTAHGCFLALRATVRAALGRDLDGCHVALQGLGNVGYGLAERLKAAGCRLTVTDLDEKRHQRARDVLGATVVRPDAILTVEADVFSPNALGAVINEATVPALRVKAVAGGANNQLATPADGVALAERGILYAPDYVANAGGVIAMCGDYYGWDKLALSRRVEAIERTMTEIFDQAAETGRPPHEVADTIAETRFFNAAG